MPGGIRTRGYRTATQVLFPLLPPVSTTLGKLVAKVAAGVADTGSKFAAGVVDTGGKFATGVVDTGGAPLHANISANFRKNSKRS